MIPLYKMFYSKTPKIKDKNGIEKPHSIASLEKVNINGVDQWILIRSHDVDNPVLLFLHGGPGSAEMALAHKYERTLEEHFIVVNWDQRGAGKSYSKKIAAESLNTEQYISDCVELVKILMNRFKKEKIYLMGHSWGSVLGIYVVQRHPEFFYAYIGIGQVANMIQNEQTSYKFVYDRAKETNNDKALKKLEEIQPYDGKDFKKIKIQRKWLTKFKGSVYNFKSEWDMMKYALGSPEYSLRDIIKFFKGSKFTIDAMLE